MEARARHVEDGGSSGSFRSAAAAFTLLADKKFEATADTGESEAILHMLREGTPLMLGVVASGGGEGQGGGSVGGAGADTGRRAGKAD